MIIRYLRLRGLDGYHTRVYPRRSLGLVDYSEPHIHFTTDVSYRSVFNLWNIWDSNPYLAASTACTSTCAFIPNSSGETPKG